MTTSNPATSRACDLVSQLTQGDPDKAEALIKFCALVDNSTPAGSAIRLQALTFAFAQTKAGQQGLDAMMQAAMAVSVLASHVVASASIS